MHQGLYTTCVQTEQVRMPQWAKVMHMVITAVQAQARIRKRNRKSGPTQLCDLVCYQDEQINEKISIRADTQ
jgi:hypothetical protein